MTRRLAWAVCALAPTACSNPKPAALGTEPSPTAVHLATENSSAEPVAPSSDAPSASARADAHPKPAGSEQLLFDGAVAPVYADAGETATVMRRYVKGWLHDVASCKRPDPFGGDLARARAAGELVPVVTRVKGAFTAPGTQQIAYFVDFGECNSDLHTRSPRRLLVLEAGASRLDLEIDPSIEGDWVQAARDVDGDGLDELVVGTAGVLRMGYQSSGAFVWALPQGRVTPGEGFTLEEATCMQGQGQDTFHRVYYRREQGKTVYRDEPVEKPCPK